MFGKLLSAKPEKKFFKSAKQINKACRKAKRIESKNVSFAVFKLINIFPMKYNQSNMKESSKHRI